MTAMEAAAFYGPICPCRTTNNTTNSTTNASSAVEFHTCTAPLFVPQQINLQLANATTVTQDGRGHGIWFGNSCIAGIVQQFVADPLRTLDTSCADVGVPVDWAAP